MSNYPNSHLFSCNNIYKIVLNIEDSNDVINEDNEKDLK